MTSISKIRITVPGGTVALFLIRFAAVLQAALVGLATENSQAQLQTLEQVSSLPYCVVDTGQTKCYDDKGEITTPSSGQAFYGQDAQFNGNQPNYTLSSDGKTVLDNVTNLTWMRGPNTTLASPTKSDKKTLSEAQAWVTTVNGMAYGGFSDWRLPSMKELYSLMNFNGTDPGGVSSMDTSLLTPFIDPAYFNFAYGNTTIGERIIDSQYISTNIFVLNPAESGSTKIFGLNLADGRIKGYDQWMDISHRAEKAFFVQLVRGRTDYATNSFADNGDGAVTDASTGLMWSKTDSGVGMIWQDALAWVTARNAANYLNHNDWRLPNAKDLHSLVNYANALDYNGMPAIDTAHFTCTGITNENGGADYPYYWTSTTHAGYSTTGSTSGKEANYIPFGRALGWPSSIGRWVDVHGAGCQRSDPKTGPPYGYATVHTVTTNGVTYTGYSFGPQGDAIRGFNYVRLVRDAPQSTAQFMLTVTMDGIGSGTVTRQPLLPLYPQGTTVTLAAEPTTAGVFPSIFTHWSGDVISTSNPLVLTMDHDTTVTARFDLMPTITGLVNHLTGAAPLTGNDLKIADVNGDGAIDAGDVIAIIQRFK
ncbi:MAG: DUF1566 domain-containing protein [Candidatus Sumerlaeota bacterium]|nr:DUF1566 domain-containing protein [Candidatus Sumerlaeota bacterium]